jgi:hypothetical protein
MTEPSSNKQVCWYGVDSTGSWQGRLTSSCEHLRILWKPGNSVTSCARTVLRDEAWAIIAIKNKRQLDSSAAVLFPALRAACGCVIWASGTTVSCNLQSITNRCNLLKLAAAWLYTLHRGEARLCPIDNKKDTSKWWSRCFQTWTQLCTKPSVFSLTSILVLINRFLTKVVFVCRCSLKCVSIVISNSTH